MYKKEEYDFVEDLEYETYKIYNKRDRSKIIAVCENVFDAQIVVKALTNGLSPLPCDCTDEIKVALDKAEKEFDEQLDEIREDHKTAIEETRVEARDEGREDGHSDSYNEGYADAEQEMKPVKEIIFDPS